MMWSVFNVGLETLLVVGFVVHDSDGLTVGLHQAVNSTDLASVAFFMLRVEVVMFGVMHFVFVVVFRMGLEH